MKEKIGFREYLRNSELNEVKKEIKDVTWSSGFGKETGHFFINDEKYEIEFDSADSNGFKLRGLKFYRIIDNKRIITYTESKEPLTVALTMKDQVKKYLDKHKPDVFGFLGDLTEKPRLRHYERLLTLLHREYKQYANSFMMDREGDRIFILSKNENILDTTIASLQQKLDV